MQSLAAVAEWFGVWVSGIEPAVVASELVTNAAQAANAAAYAQLLAAYLSWP